MVAQRVTVRERIDPAITASLFANYRSSADAVMELVDNSIDSRIKGHQLEVLLQVHPSYFVIETRGGEGMGPAELERNYLRWGGSPKRGRKLLVFVKRGGDIWYQLETAAREVFKSLEGATAADYERRVNEVILLAFQLRARRREARSRKTTTQLPLISC
ncbi:MAG TPA: hypothetical protein VHJ99_03060 [Candidatus Dormibacteraeota bacterium]|nr:hypothetical protein [Candidatus Dormibacteraeota bacterium]